MTSDKREGRKTSSSNNGWIQPDNDNDDKWRVVAERLRSLDSSSCVSDQLSVGSRIATLVSLSKTLSHY